MSHQHENEVDRLMDLLVKRTTKGLVEEEARELEDLSHRYPEVDQEQFDLSAAAVACVVGELSAPPLPDSVRRRLAIALDQFRADSTKAAQSPGKAARSTFADRPKGLRSALWVAVIVCLGLAAAGWWPRRAGVAPLDSRVLMMFAAKHPDVVWLPWSDGVAADNGEAREARGVAGEVVWSDKANRGYVRIRGLAVNDPDREAYQLWIVDSTRELSPPVSAGLFNVASTEPVVKAIEPAVSIGKAVTFVVTIERSGGVVVSDMKRRAGVASRERLLLER